MARSRVSPQPITKVNAERLILKDKQAAAAKRAEKAAQKKAFAEMVKATKSAPVVPPVDPAVVAAKQQAEREAALAAQRVDFEALMPEDQTFDEFLADAGYNPDGSVRVAEKQTYQGPMLALVTARRHYVKAPNGILCNGDLLATALGGLNREQVVDVLVQALGMGSNPYTALNPGQQSMNLRNRARVAVRKGTLKLEDIVAAVEKAARRPA